MQLLAEIGRIQLRLSALILQAVSTIPGAVIPEVDPALLIPPSVGDVGSDPGADSGGSTMPVTYQDLVTIPPALVPGLIIGMLPEKLRETVKAEDILAHTVQSFKIPGCVVYANQGYIQAILLRDGTTICWDPNDIDRRAEYVVTSGITWPQELLVY
jgi:hypothetical protein